MSAISEYLNDEKYEPALYDDAGWKLLDLARAELAALRSRIDALENDIVCAFCGAHYKADDVPPQHYLTCEKSPLVQRIAEQARQLDEARDVMTATIAGAGTGHMRRWLDANPAPQEDDTQQ